MFDFSNAKDIQGIFEYCAHLSNLNLDVDFRSLKVAGQAFYSSGIEKLDTTNTRNSNIEKAPEIFSDCKKLQSIYIGNLFGNKTKDLCQAFKNSINLKTVSFGHQWGKRLIDIRSIFENCYSLEEMNLGNLYLDNVIYVSRAYMHCKNLRVLNLNGFTINAKLFENTEERLATAMSFTSGLIFGATKLHQVYFLGLSLEGMDEPMVPYAFLKMIERIDKCSTSLKTVYLTPSVYSCIQSLTVNGSQYITKTIKFEPKNPDNHI